MKTIATELNRLGLSASIVDDEGNGIVCVEVEGWPDRVWYDQARSLAVMLWLDDGHALTASGDADLCRRLEESGAYIGSDD